MRANSSFSSLVVVVLILASGCRPAEDQTAVVAPPEPPPPGPAPERSELTLDELLDQVEPVRSGPSQAGINEIRERAPSDRPPQQLPVAVEQLMSRAVPRLVYQCTDDVTFAVQVVGSRLRAFPPGYSNGFIVLTEVPSDDGVHYTARDADFRAKDDLATLQVGRDRYVDCVSNPAAAVWQEPPHRDTR